MDQISLDKTHLFELHGGRHRSFRFYLFAILKLNFHFHFHFHLSTLAYQEENDIFFQV